jgi:DNA recombination protein RmuC
MDGYLTAIIVLGIVIIVLTAISWFRRQPDYSQSFTLLQQRIGQVEEQVKRGLDDGNKTIGEKFENSLKVIGEIKKTIGSLDETNKRMLEIGRDIASIQDLLAPPKIRGEIGEVTLNNILREILPQQNFEEQYRFKNGNIVDAVIKIGDRIVSIDSKFPLESFNRYTVCAEDKEKMACLREFCRSVKSKIDDISAKYILEDESTFDFALMYIPSENIYYQTILKNDFQLEDKSIAEYALGRRVVIVSPNSIYAYLRVIHIGLRGLQVERNVRRIMDDFGRLSKELEKFEKQFDTLGSHLNHAQSTFDGASRQLNVLSTKITLAGQSSAIDEIEKNR